MLFFILAGGYGKRAEPLSLIKPKPLFPLNGTPIIRIILEQLKQKGLNRGFINLHYKPRMIRDCTAGDMKIKYLYEEELSGSMILNEAARSMDDVLLVVNGDIFLDIPAAEMQEKMSAAGCDGILLLRRSDKPGYPTIILKDGCYVKRKKNGDPHGLMYTGTALFKKKVIERIDRINFFETLDKGEFRIMTVIYRGLWLDIGDPLSYFGADAAYREFIKAPGSNSLSPQVRISADSQVKNSIIWENSNISSGSKITNCIVTGNVELNNATYADKIISENEIYDLRGQFL